jgi:hypothetical protein
MLVQLAHQLALALAQARELGMAVALARVEHSAIGGADVSNTRDFPIAALAVAWGEAVSRK